MQFMFWEGMVPNLVPIECTVCMQQFVVVTKKPPMCQIMHFSLYCMNGLIEERIID